MFQDHAYMEFQNPDYVKFAESCGAVGMRAETAEELQHAITEAIQPNRPVLIDAVVDGEVYANMSQSM